MNQADYDEVRKRLLDAAEGIQTAKRPGYTGGNPDVLHNFKGVAERLGQTPEMVWGVYFLKHIDAILSIMTKPDLPVSEEPLGRFADAINYLQLGWGLLQEREGRRDAFVKKVTEQLNTATVEARRAANAWMFGGELARPVDRSGPSSAAVISPPQETGCRCPACRGVVSGPLLRDAFARKSNGHLASCDCKECVNV